METTKGEFLKNCTYYGLLAIFVFFFIDWATLPLLKIGGMNVYCGDVLHFLVMVTAVWTVIRAVGGGWGTPRPRSGTLLFLAWLTLAVGWGWRIYGYRAFGESRYVLPFFAFFIPYPLLTGKRSDDPSEGRSVYPHDHLYRGGGSSSLFPLLAAKREAILFQ